MSGRKPSPRGARSSPQDDGRACRSPTRPSCKRRAAPRRPSSPPPVLRAARRARGSCWAALWRPSRWSVAPCGGLAAITSQQPAGVGHGTDRGELERREFPRRSSALGRAVVPLHDEGPLVCVLVSAKSTGERWLSGRGCTGFSGPVDSQSVIRQPASGDRCRAELPGDFGARRRPSRRRAGLREHHRDRLRELVDVARCHQPARDVVGDQRIGRSRQARRQWQRLARHRFDQCATGRPSRRDGNTNTSAIRNSIRERRGASR